MKGLMSFEVDKVIKKRSALGAALAIVIILLGIFYIGFHYSHLGLVNRNNTSKGAENIYWEKVQKFEGSFSNQKIESILSDFIDDYQRFKPEDRPFDLYSSNIADIFFSKDQDDIYLRMNEAIDKGEKINITDIKLNKIEDVGFSSSYSNLKIGSYITWSDLYKVHGAVFILSVVVCIVICSDSFSGDTSKNIESLLKTTKYGRLLLPRIKIIVATFLSMSILWLLEIITFAVFFLYNKGLSGWDASIQTNFLLKQFAFSSQINQLQILGIQIVLYSFAIIFISSLSLVVSAISQTSTLSLIAATSLFILPMGLIKIFREGLINAILYIFPVNNYTINNILAIFSNKNIVFPFSFEGNIILICLIFTVFALLNNVIICKKIKR